MSESNSNKQTFLHGAALLTMAMLFVKLAGALYKIPLNAIIGEQGFGYFSTAYQVYSVLLLISTAGLPVAVSRMISAAAAQGHYQQVRRIYKTARILFLSLGAVSSALMILFSHQLANFQHQPNAWVAITCLGPCAFLVCLLSTYRGFFQGQGNMLPTSISEIIEAACKLFVGVAAAVAVYRLTDDVAFAAGGAILGVTFGALAASLFMGAKFHKAYHQLPHSEEAPGSYRSILKGLLAVAVPITIGSAGLESLYVIETNLYMGQLLSTGFTQDQADVMKGIYDMARTIYNMPCAFITPLTISIIPAITSHLTLGDLRNARATEESVARIAGLIASPCAVGLAVMARPVTALLGSYTGTNLDLAAALMATLGIGLYFYAAVQVTNAIMQANGHATLPVINILFAGIVKLVLVYFLVGNPRLSIVGVPIGATLCNILVAILNIVGMRRVMNHKPSIIRNSLRSAVSSLIMGACVFGVCRLLGRFFEETSRSGKLILCAVPILVGVGIYAVCAVKLRAITREDCLLLPKGEKIASFLHL